MKERRKMWMFNLPEQEWDRLKKFGHVEPGTEVNYGIEGLYYGGDKLIEDKLNRKHYLPYSIDEIIEAGMEKFSGKTITLKHAGHLEREIKNALQEKHGYSVVRIGDGELLYLAHDIIYSSEEINNEPRLRFLDYAGVRLPNHGPRDELTENLIQSNAIGIPIARMPTYQNLLTKLVNHHQWNLEKMNVFTSTVHFEMMNYTTLLDELLRKYKVLLIGNRMADGRRYFEKRGYDSIVGAIPVKGIKDVPNVIEQAGNFKYDVALVSAGISANLICQKLANKQKVAIDFGHAIDLLMAEHLTIKSLDNGTIKSNNCCNIATYYIERDDFEFAKEWYEKALEIGGENITAHLQLCLCYWELGDHDQAKKHHERARQINPTHPSVIYNHTFFNHFK